MVEYIYIYIYTLDIQNSIQNYVFRFEPCTLTILYLHESSYVWRIQETLNINLFLDIFRKLDGTTPKRQEFECKSIHWFNPIISYLKDQSNDYDIYDQ